MPAATPFFVIGLALSVPMLRRLHRRFESWWALDIVIGVFAAVFSLSAFVIGPAFSGQPEQGSTPGPSPTATLDEHGGHHS